MWRLVHNSAGDSFKLLAGAPPLQVHRGPALFLPSALLSLCGVRHGAAAGRCAEHDDRSHARRPPVLRTLLSGDVERAALAFAAGHRGEALHLRVNIMRALPTHQSLVITARMFSFVLAASPIVLSVLIDCSLRFHRPV